MKKLHGVTVAMVTPMDSRGAFLKEAMEQLTEALIARGADCLYPCGTTGEMSRLNFKERKEIASVVVKTAKKRVPVYIHAGADTPKETIELALYARQIGADGVGVVPPVFLHMSSREMQNYYLEVAGIKYSYLDLNRTLEYLQVGEDFSVLHGCDKVFASLLVLGCGGTVSGVAGVFPEPFTEVYRAYQEKELECMERWQKVCVEICDNRKQSY
ncbi:MAG: dihydrodipicolinate synthase family protein [Lachnospiraceae bacterium]|nr:dihydrodipicolinate synthase family protein [Lachnospiraceae bacterium]